MIDTEKITEFGANFKALFLRWLSTIATLCFLIALFFIQFTQVKIKVQTLETLISSFSILFICFIFIDRLQYRKGRAKGEESEKYINVQKKHSDIINSLKDNQIVKLREFCILMKEKADKELKTEILKTAGLAYDQYEKEKYISKSNKEISSITSITKKQQRAIIKANKINCKTLKESELFSENKTRSNVEYDLGSNKNNLEIKNAIQNIIQSVIATILACVCALNLSEDFHWTMFIWYLLQLSLLLFKCISTYMTGYRDITERIYNRIIKKIDILRKFNIWYENSLEVVNDNTINT